MDELVRARLRQLVDTYGPDLAEDPRRLRALLNDILPSHRREVSSLVAAADEGIASDLRRQIGRTPDETLLAQLSHRLIRDRAMDSDAARWAVASWAEALGLRPGPIVTPSRAADPLATVSTMAPAAPPPNPPERPGRRRWMWIAAAGGVALLGVLAVTRMIAPPGTGPGPSSVAESSFSSSAPSRSAAPELVLREYIPAAFRETCAPRDAEPLEGSIEELVCTADGADGVSYVQYPSDDEMYAEYDVLAADRAPDGAGTGTCPTEIPAEGPWSYGDTPETDAGRYLCYLDEDGIAWVVWTTDAPRIYAWATRADGDMQALRKVWADDLGPDRP